MSSKWQTFKLRELGRIVTGKTPKTADAKNFGGRIPFITPSDMDGRKTIRSTVRYLTATGASSVKGSLIPSGSIMVSCIGSDMGKTVVAGYDCVTNQQINSIIVDKRFNSDFVYYNLSMRKSELQLLASSGSTMPILNKSLFSCIDILIPPLPTQTEIADILSTLDDRIELLRETNTTLEAIAQALFKSWFVDFDPVRAKQEGREPEGMDADTAALFPDSFEESGLGLVPKGWRRGKFCELARLQKGSINPLRSPETIFQHFSLPAFDNGEIPVTETGSEIKSNKTSMPVDSVLVSKLNPHIPRIWLPSEVENNSVCSTEFLVFVPKGSASKEFIYSYFKTSLFQQLLCRLVTGTSNSHQRVKPDAVSLMPAIIPLNNVLEAFELRTKPLFEQIRYNRLRAKTLASIRDTLLPRLISGQLRIPEAEALIEETAA